MKNQNTGGGAEKAKYAELQKKITEAPQRNLTGSLQQCEDELRDAYMNFKELSERCILDIKEMNKTDEAVYYFRPDTFLLDEPEKQRYFRQQLIKKISGMPKPEPISYLGDEMHRAYVGTIQDQSGSVIAKRNLALFFKRRQYALQHLKYKLLNRWAHLSLTSESLERTGSEATFMYGKMEYSLEQAMTRHERLAQDDYYDIAKPENRPNTKAELGEGSLYVEKVDMLPQSLIREDDVEIYMRGVSYRNKVSKVANKYMSRLKWLPMQHRYAIMEKAHEAFLAQKKGNIKDQLTMVDRVEARIKQHHILTPEVEQELSEILNGTYARKYAMMYTTETEEIQNAWRSDHEAVPDYISNQHHLKIKITDLASKYKLDGDIELDHGYSFSYQVTVKFPSYFQQQVIKSQFSLYDLFAEEDKNQRQKLTLHNMTRIDTNIFRDISTTRNQVPSDESLVYELRNEDLKIIRLKSANYWIDYVCLLPTEPEWHKKQQAILHNNNPIDSLVKAGMNFLDVNDLASVNRINEDNAILHQQSVKKLNAYNPHDQIKVKTVTTQDGDRKLNVNLTELKSMSNEAANTEKHLLAAVQGVGIASEMGSGKTEMIRPVPEPAAASRTGLKATPQHLLVSYYTLRYMRSKDSKTRILYTLNFYRSIQKRIALDLREFGTRERIDTHLAQPYVHSSDANKNIVNKASYASNLFESGGNLGGKKGKGGPQDDSDLAHDKKLTVFDSKAIEEMNNMASMRQYKFNGVFNNQIFSTCPSFPKFHCTFGEPTQKVTMDMEMDLERSQAGGVSAQSLKLMGRIDRVELDDAKEEVYVKDDFGVYILYDCVLQDMKGLEDELIKIASYYLSKSEVLQDPHSEKPQPGKDRLEMLDDLLQCEARFQYRKVKLVLAYVECYEHVVDPLEQQRLMQVITDIMARRPRLNLQASYFKDAYAAESDCLEKQLELVKLLIDYQVSIEKTENKRLQDSLSLSYTLTNQYEQNRWKYQDAEALLSAIVKNKRQKKAAQDYADMMDKQRLGAAKDGQSQAESASAGETSKAQSSHPPASSEGKKEKEESEQLQADHKDNIPEVVEEAGDDSDGSSMTELKMMEQQENVFQQLLGLPEISIETLYMQYKEKDKTIIKLMNEHTNFIQVHEGYPEFLNFQQGGSGGANVKTFKPCPWSQEVGNLDFYDSLDFINKFYAITQQMQQELYDALKPFDTSIMTCIDAQVAEYSLQEYRKVLKYMEGAEVEYAGRQYFEDESIMGNSEKMVFLAKEMISQLTLTPKHALDPYLISKLDIQTINFFDYPRLKKADNKYDGQFQDGSKAADWVVKLYKQQMADIAKRKSQAASVNINHILATSQIQVTNNRNVEVPTQLETYCNLMELMRLRHEIILTMSECQVLKKIYLQQCESCHLGLKVELPDSVSFEEIEETEEADADLINFIDDGPARQIIIDLDIKEFDPKLLSNLNFRAPDAFKLCITTAGLEEVRAVLRYQLMQKHLLIVATRVNQLMMDPCLKAIAEVELLKNSKLSLPNTTIAVLEAFSKNADQLSDQNMKTIRQKFAQNLSGVVASVFYSVAGKKNQQRTNLAKEYSNYQARVSRAFPAKTQVVHRIMRSFKVKQLTKYCQSIMNEIFLDAQKVQAVQVCQRLRDLSHYFDFDMSKLGMGGAGPGKGGGEEETCQVFKYETSTMTENFTYAYMPKEESVSVLDDGEASRREVRVLNPADLTILNYHGIPSSTNLMHAEATAPEELATFRKKQLAVLKAKYGAKSQYEELKQIDPEIKYPEQTLKQMLESLTLHDAENSASKGKPEATDIDDEGYVQLDYEEALYFCHSNYAKMMRYYQHLERIIQLEWFIYKLQFKQNDIVFLDNAIQNGLPFWQSSDYEERLKQEMPPAQINENFNKISQEFFYSKIVTMRTKRDIAEELSGMSMVLRNLIQKFQDTPEKRRYEYLNSYTEFRYMQIVGSIHKLVEQYYIEKKDPRTIRTLKQAVSHLTKMDHVNVSYARSNSYHVNTSLVHPHMQFIESTNLIHGAFSEDEHINFARCVRPVINERALEPAQVTLFQSLYQTDNFRKRLPSQFAGQLVSTHNAMSFPSLANALLDMKFEERQYAQSFITQAQYQCNDFMETALNTCDPGMTREQVYSISQLKDAKDFLRDNTTSLLLKNAVMCWHENQVLPDDPAVYERWEKNFRSQFFWKIIEQKENLIQARAARGDLKIPSKAQLVELANKITELQDSYSLATMDEEVERDKMVAVLREEFSSMKKKVTLDTHYAVLAEALVLKNEIEKHISRAAIAALDGENAALSKCFTQSIPKIQYHIHPFQQFAATFYDQVDPNLHLDVSNKIEPVQTFLTRLRNRGTEVETLTSGPGMVFTQKDINECIQDFCRSIIKFGEKELKSRSDLLCQKENHYKRLIYIKDQKITDMQRRIDNTGKNMDNLINAKLFEKGNQLIYQLDNTSRLLILFKQTMFGLENQIRDKILGEQHQKFKLQKDEFDCAIERFNDYKNHIKNIVAVDFEDKRDRLEKEMVSLVNKVREIAATSTYQAPTLYPGTGSHRYGQQAQGKQPGAAGLGGPGAGAGMGMGMGGNNAPGKLNLTAAVGSLPGTIIPPGFTHYTHCSCYIPNPKKPHPTMHYAELEMMSEQEARFELAQCVDLMRKQRLFWRTKEMLMKQKYQNKVNLMKKQLSNNSYLWDQMAEGEKREKILKQELLFTQQSLSAAEKVIEKLQEEMKKVEADRSRLYKYKHSKAERLKELEDKIKKFEVYENIDTDKLINVLDKKDKEVTQLKGIADNFTTRLDISEKRKEAEVKKLKQNFLKEQVKTQQIVDKMEQMKLELKMLESNDTSVAAIWKKKCLDLFEVCQTLKGENEELRDRCKELIVQGIQLADAMNNMDDGHAGLMNGGDRNQVSLPKLLTNTSVQRMNQQQQPTSAGFQKQIPETAGVTSGRHVSTANTYDLTSTNMDFQNYDKQTPFAMQRNYGDMPSVPSEGRQGVEDISDGALHGQFAQPYDSAQGQDGVRKSNKQFAVTMNAKQSNNFGTNAGQMTSLIRSPQQQYMLGGPNIPGRRGGREQKAGVPQTSQQPRGRTVGAAGPTYHMPQSQQGRTPPYTRNSQKPIQPQSIIGSAHQPDRKVDSSFNQSFYASQEPTTNSALQNKSQNAQKRSGQQAYDSADMTSASYVPVAQRQHRLQAQPPTVQHNDSLFESSKASTNYQTSLINKRQFPSKGRGPGGQQKGNNYLSSQKKSEIAGAGVFGSKMQPSKVNTQLSTQGKSEGLNDLRKPQDSIIGETSFAAENAQTMDNENEITESTHLQRYVQEATTKHD